jgi:hypothetical protein
MRIQRTINHFLLVLTGMATRLMPNNNFDVRRFMEGIGRFIGHLTLHSMGAGIVNVSPVLVEFLKSVRLESIVVTEEDVMEPTLAMQIVEVVCLLILHKILCKKCIL